MNTLDYRSIFKTALQRTPKTLSLSPEPDRAAVAIAFQQLASTAEHGSSLRFLMIRRAISPTDRWSGQMAFPGGKKESGDSSLVATATREVQEEIGLELDTQTEFLGTLDEIQGRTSGAKIPLAITPFVYWLKNSPINFQIDKTEVHSVSWIDLSHCLQKSSHKEHPLKISDSLKVSLPCITNSPAPIWGISYLMLKNLIDLSFSVTTPEAFVRPLGGDYTKYWRGYPKSL